MFNGEYCQRPYLLYTIKQGEYAMSEKNNNNKEAIWVDKETHDLLWIFKVKKKEKSIGEVASRILKETISKELEK